MFSDLGVQILEQRWVFECLEYTIINSFFLEKGECLNNWMVQIIRHITVLFEGFIGKPADNNDS